jgi:predicted ribosome quality control (RQC) complex YloA/Tae2 family protein
MVNYIIQNININNKDYNIYIGKNSFGNEEIIKLSNSDSLWFHFENISSAHIILENKGDKIPKQYIRKIGKMLYLYKKNIPKYTKIIYTQIKNIKLTNIIGTVIPANIKILN